ncbi:nucleotide exchange factor GrpE [Amycolatopsis sp. NPDC101161]|uniref:nucleotide exchange factor GrpE n=1 Tax=Amycolatopsis sp. NPDC101161 TaxID=3363940 RepID=UPI0037F8BB39
MTTHPADPPDAGDETGERDEIDALRARVADLENRWRSTAADFDNFRKRTARDAEQAGVLERARVAAAWLPVLDNLDMALDHARADPATIVAGVRAVRNQADDVMARLGFPRREDEAGTPFDPAAHEAVGAVPAAGFAPGTIVEVVRSGYGGGEHQLRPAAVMVASRAD